MRLLKHIAALALFLSGLNVSAQQLDSLTRKTLSDKLDEYFATIEPSGTDVQKEEADFLIVAETPDMLTL